MPGGGTLTIATALRVLDSSYCDSSSYALVAGDYVCVSVIDTGSGMSEEIKKHLFEPFFTTKPRGQGTGMGLAAVFGTVTGHRGAIEVESESGTGSRFTILLPAGAPLDALPAVSPEKIDTLPEGLTVMVVDDEDAVRRVAATVLQRAGCTVITCSGGAEAIERYRSRQKHIDLVIADMVMPGMNGRDLFAALRAVDPRAAILITSGYTSGSDIEELLRDGARGLLQKPYLVHELISAVLRAIS